MCVNSGPKPRSQPRSDEGFGLGRVGQRTLPLSRALGEDLRAFATDLERVVQGAFVPARNRDVCAEEHAESPSILMDERRPGAAVAREPSAPTWRYTRKHDARTAQLRGASVGGACDPARRPRRVLRRRRAARPSRMARQAGHRGRRPEPPGRGVDLQLRGARVRGALGDVVGARGRAVPRRDLDPGQLRALPRDLLGGARDLRRREPARCSRSPSTRRIST